MYSCSSTAYFDTLDFFHAVATFELQTSNHGNCTTYARNNALFSHVQAA